MKLEMNSDAVKTSFVLHSNYLNQLNSLSLEDRGIWITAIFHYVNDLPLPEMDMYAKLPLSAKYVVSDSCSKG